MTDYRERARRLKQARNAAKQKGLVDSTKTLASMATPWGFFSLFSQIRFDWPFWFAIFAALLKDISDYVGIGSLPAIGTVITICCSIFIGFMMLLGGSTGKRRTAQKVMRKFLVLSGGTLIELLFGINFLPIETLTILVIYFMFLAERKQAAEEEKRMRNAQSVYA